MSERTLSGETALGMPVAFYAAETELGGHFFASHWSTIPEHRNPVRLFTESAVEARFAALSAKLVEAEQKLTYSYATKARCNDDANFERRLRLAAEARVAELEKALKLAKPHVVAAAADRIAGAQKAFDAICAALAATKEPKP